MEIALSKFQLMLSPEQAAQLSLFSSTPPTADDVVQLTNQIIEFNKNRKSNILAGRFYGLLSSVQQYYSIVDICAGPNQIAALVWGSVKLVILVGLCNYLCSSLIYQ